MPTIIICLILIVIGIYAVISYKKRLSSGCCGASGQPSVKRVKVQDKDLSHYPHHKILKVDGMSCGNCTVRVENALNSLDGVWARVNLMEEEADLYLKQDVSDDVLREAVKSAGYTVYKIKTIDE